MYDIRFQMREISYPTLFKYFLAALLVFCPLILSKFMYEKKYLFSILFIIIIYLDFSIEGLKSIIFLSFVAICIHLLHKIKLLHYIPIILSILLILSFALNDTLKTAVSFIILNTHKTSRLTAKSAQNPRRNDTLPQNTTARIVPQSSDAEK